MDPSRFILVYTTLPSREQATKVASILVKKRLAACCNIINNVTSVYEWEAQVHVIEEVILLAKTTQERWDEIQETLKSLSPWKCPAIIAWHPTSGSPDFLSWVQSQTQ